MSENVLNGFLKALSSGTIRVVDLSQPLDAGTPRLELLEADEPDRYSIQLYHRVAVNAGPLEGKLAQSALLSMRRERAVEVHRSGIDQPGSAVTCARGAAPPLRVPIPREGV